MNKSKELQASIELINKKLHFNGLVENNDPISIDYTPPLGDNLGYTSLELLLLSLSSCVGSVMLIFLKRMEKNIAAFKINATGIRKEEHPSGFSKIILKIDLDSKNTAAKDIQKIIGMIDSVCPVKSMIKDDVEVEIKYCIN